MLAGPIADFLHDKIENQNFWQEFYQFLLAILGHVVGFCHARASKSVLENLVETRKKEEEAPSVGKIIY